jgi:hypothetical protein
MYSGRHVGKRMETTMKTCLFRRSSTRATQSDAITSRPPRRNMMFGKAALIIGVCALAGYSTERLYEHLNERIELERHATMRMWQYTAAYSGDFWRLLAMHTR